MEFLDSLKALVPDYAKDIRLNLDATIARSSLPAREAVATAPVVLSREADDETKAKRKAAKERKQAEARSRREQAAKARNRA